MAINERFIKTVFNRLVDHRPKLGYLLPDDDDDDDVDPRKLANEIISNYPWPIGVELRRLLSASMSKHDRGRLDHIFRTLERIMQFVAFIMVSQLVEEKIKENIELGKSFSDEFLKRFIRLSMGDYAWLIRTIGKMFTQNNITPFLGDMQDILNSSFYKKLDFWTPERNEIGHYQITLTDEEIEVRCHEYMDRLQDIICDLSFLAKSSLITITDIKVMKPKRTPAVYDHHMLLLNSVSSDFSGRAKTFENYTDSHSVLLVNSLKSAPDNYLSLSPLIIDTHFETIESREKLRKVRKDIYLYTRWDLKAERLFFVGTEAEEKVDLRLISFYDQLVKEFKEILTEFGG